jgi:hypothetical protein
MKKNMGSLDRLLRTGFAVIVAILYFIHVIEGTLAAVLGVLAGVMLLTSLIGFCPLYPLVGISTCKKKD